MVGLIPLVILVVVLPFVEGVVLGVCPVDI